MGKGEHEETTVNPRIQTSPLRYDKPSASNNKIGPTSKGRIEMDSDMDHQQALDRQRHRREREPLLYCKLVTRWPLQAFLLTLAGHILMVLISVGLLASGYDLLPIDFETLPLEINNQPWRPRDLAWTYRDNFPGYYDRTPTSGWRVYTYPRANFDLYYDGQGGNVFTKNSLKAMEVIENKLYSQRVYQDRFCQLNSTGSCEKITSILRYFDGTYSYVDPVFNDPNFDNITGVIYEAFTNVETKGDFYYFLGKSFSITQNKAFSLMTRSNVPMGRPIQGFPDIEDYEAEAKVFSVDHMKPVLEDARENSAQFDFSYRSDMLWMADVLNQAMKDVLCAAGSICFIFVFILIHTKSVWITGFAILSIMTSFVTTNLIYRVVLDFQYIGFFHVLTLFIVLGIGADDVFVFYDVWKNTAFESYPSLAHRLSDSYRKSVFSMLFTSITTAVAFFASAISPLLATRAFGVFSGLVIIVNYLSVIIYFPTVVILYHTKFEKFKWPCVQFFKKNVCTCCNKDDNDSAEDQVRHPNNYSFDTVPNSKFAENGDLFKKIPPKPLSSKNEKSTAEVSITERQKSFSTHIKIENPNPHGTSGNATVTDYSYINDVYDTEAGEDVKQPGGDNPERTRDSEAIAPKKRKKKSFMVRFFRDKYSAFVTHKIFRWLILAVMVAVLVAFAIQASRLEPDNEGLDVLPDSHVYTIAKDHAINSFVLSNSDRTIILYIVWGMHPNVMDNCHFSTPKCKGEKKWDTTFDPSTTEAQDAVQSMCDEMMNWTPAQAAEYRVRKDITTGQYQINCYITHLDTFLQDETNITGTDWNLTYDYSKAISFMDARTSDYNSTGFTSAYDDYLQIPISYWLSNRNTFNLTNDFYMFDSLIGEEEGTYSKPLLSDSTKKYGNNIKYVAIQVNTTITVQNLGYAEGIPIMNRWEEFVNGQMKTMPTGMNNAFQTTAYIWHWLIVSEMLATNAIYGIIIGVSLALPILIIATRNVITGCLATFSMCCSTVCVVGVIPLGGWKLGVLESLNMCMVVGLTVDYVVHLAEGYTLSLHRDRAARLRDMLEEMAVSVFFGACTTLGASMFMFIAKLSFFLQFGLFMFSTVGFSLFFAMGMFVTLMGLVGPQGDAGNLVVLFRNIRTWCSKKRSKGMPPSESKAQLAPGNMPLSASTTSFASSNGKLETSKP